MKPGNEQFLKDNLYHFITLERAFYLRSLSGQIRENMQRVMSEEFQPGYTADIFCPSCCAEMIRTLYRNYFNWLKSKLNDNNEYKDLSEGITKMNERLNFAATA